MSRAVDKDVTTSLFQADNASAVLDAYEAISAIWSSPCPSEAESGGGGGLLEIEILPRGHPALEPPGTHLVRDGNAVAVAKVGLTQAFVVARRILRGHRLGTEDDGAEDEVLVAGKKSEMLLAATATVLLWDPEHLTAANTRKRIVRARAAAASWDADHEAAVWAVVGREKQVVDSLLTGRLHRHAKSPTLWSHRRWLLTLLSDMGLELLRRLDVGRDIVDVIMVAGERHARNYYAWCHARWLIGNIDLRGHVARCLVGEVTRWCYRHHTDISGWSFLHYLLWRPVSSDRDGAAAAGRDQCRVTFDEVLHRVKLLGWANESVWVFLRTMAASGLLNNPSVTQFRDVARSFIEGSGAPDKTKMLQDSIEWCESHRVRA